MSDNDETNNQLEQINVKSPIKSQKKISTDERSNSQIFMKAQSSNSFYEETFYITGIRENYLILLSQSLQILQFPIGIVKSDVEIGQPITVKLEYDKRRHQNDRKKFQALQNNLKIEYSQIKK